jgi:hypothetical protein
MRSPLNPPRLPALAGPHLTLVAVHVPVIALAPLYVIGFLLWILRP